MSWVEDTEHGNSRRQGSPEQEAKAQYPGEPDFQALSEFRHQIRRFLHFTEEAARAEGLEPQQHQLLLAARALDESGGPTVGRLAGYLLIRHHSAVGLIDRLEERGLVERSRGGGDRRQVRILLTAEGRSKLDRLSQQHWLQLRNAGPELVAALGSVLERVSGNSSPTGKLGEEGPRQDASETESGKGEPGNLE
jgi:DNA-binding MarR family transcriptional regulator